MATLRPHAWHLHSMIVAMDPPPPTALCLKLPPHRGQTGSQPFLEIAALRASTSSFEYGFVSTIFAPVWNQGSPPSNMEGKLTHRHSSLLPAPHSPLPVPATIPLTDASLIITGPFGTFTKYKFIS